MLLVCHPTGTGPAREAALALNDAGLLSELWTCINYQPRGMMRRLIPERFARQLLRRSFPPELAGRIRAAPLREMIRLFAPRAGLHRLVGRDHGLFSADAIRSALDRSASARLGRVQLSGVYAYEGGAERLFREAKERGLTRFYDLPWGYWRAARDVLQEEAQLRPEWAEALGAPPPSASRSARLDAELSLAEIVFVPSTFALSTLDLAPDFTGTVVVIPYGAPARPSRVTNPATGAGDRPLRALYVGPLAQRKGLSYLLDACATLGRTVQLTLVGSRPRGTCRLLDAALLRHRWVPPTGGDQVAEELARHDVLVFPSLHDGFGAILLEAMAAGLPVITTPHTAGPDVIDDGVQGFVVPIRSAAALAEKLETLHRDPVLRRDMGEAARQRADELSWENYRNSLAACACSVLAGR